MRCAERAVPRLSPRLSFSYKLSAAAPEYEKETASKGSTGGARREHSGNLNCSVHSRSVGFSTASSSKRSSTFFLDLAEAATPLALCHRRARTEPEIT